MAERVGEPKMWRRTGVAVEVGKAQARVQAPKTVRMYLYPKVGQENIVGRTPSEVAVRGAIGVITHGGQS